MKILSVGYHNPHFISFTEYVERAIAGLGHELQTFEHRSFIIPGRIRDRVHFLNQLDLIRINQNLIRRVKEYKPDLLLGLGPWPIFPETISKIKKIGNITTVSWIADYPLLFKEYLKSGPSYDYFFTSSTDALERYRRAGCSNGYWLPFGCDPEIHKKVELSSQEISDFGNDICFVGSLYSERIQILNELCEFDLGIWGIGWQRLGVNSPLKKFIRGGILKSEQWVKAFNASKIVLNIICNKCDVVDPEIEEINMVNTRVFEVLGCGAFQLAEPKRDLLRLFIPKQHLDCYDNTEHLKEIIRYYLKNDKERREIARKGHELVIAKHTYRHRIEEMFSVIKMK